jgi:hypothetical protein
MRVNNNQLFDTCHYCISYLTEKGVNEKSLFRNNAFMSDVKRLQDEIIQGIIMNNK